LRSAASACGKRRAVSAAHPALIFFNASAAALLRFRFALSRAALLLEALTKPTNERPVQKPNAKPKQLTQRDQKGAV